VLASPDTAHTLYDANAGETFDTRGVPAGIVHTGAVVGVVTVPTLSDMIWPEATHPVNEVGFVIIVVATEHDCVEGVTTT